MPSVTRRQTAMPAFRALLMSSGRRVMTAAMPAATAEAAETNARSRAKDPKRSKEAPPFSPDGLALLLRGGPRIAGPGLGLSGRGFVLRGALGLDFIGSEGAVARQFSLDQGLGAVHESVGQGIAADVAHSQRFALSLDDEIHPAGEPRNRAGAHRPADADAVVNVGRLHGGKFHDGVVICLALSRAHPPQPAQRHQDDG